MAKSKANDGQIKEAVKKALQELLVEDREFLREILLQAAEDAALGEAIMEARKSKPVSRESIFKILKGQK